MNERHVLLKVQALHAGRALDRQATLVKHVAAPSNVLIVAFVRMGGMSRPWAVAWGAPGQAPTVVSTPDPRNSENVEEMLDAFRKALAEHLGEQRAPRIPQVWLPDSTHLDMLFDLGRRFTWRRGGDRPRAMNELGRMCGWLFREGTRPGGQVVQVATSALRDAYVFPDEESRLGKLDYLLSWLPPLREEQEWATSKTTAALDSNVENDELAPLLDEIGRAGAGGAADLERKVTEVVEREVRLRFLATNAAYERLAADTRRENRHLAPLVGSSSDRVGRFQRMEAERRALPIDAVRVANFATDSYPLTAARTFLTYEKDEDILNTMLLHDDPMLAMDAQLAGNVARGTVVELEPADRLGAPPNWRSRPSGPGRVVLADPPGHPLRLRADSKVCLLGRPDIEVELVSVDLANNGGALLELFMPDCSGLTIGQEFAVTEFCFESLNRSRILKLNVKDEADRPGSWLTRSFAGPEFVGAEPEQPDLDLRDANA